MDRLNDNLDRVYDEKQDVIDDLESLKRRYEELKRNYEKISRQKEFYQRCYQNCEAVLNNDGSARKNQSFKGSFSGYSVHRHQQ